VKSGGDLRVSDDWDPEEFRASYERGQTPNFLVIELAAYL